MVNGPTASTPNMAEESPEAIAIKESYVNEIAAGKPVGYVVGSYSRIKPRLFLNSFTSTKLMGTALTLCGECGQVVSEDIPRLIPIISAITTFSFYLQHLCHMVGHKG